MIDIQIGKALIAVPLEKQCNNECMNDDYKCPIDCCKGCVLKNEDLAGVLGEETCGTVCCSSGTRKDGKSVIFKLVDYPIK